MPVALDDEPESVRDRTATGIFVALLGHLLTVVALAVSLTPLVLGGGKVVGWLWFVFPAGQLIIALACLATALGLRGRDPGHLRRGLAIGWFLGLSFAWLIAAIGFWFAWTAAITSQG